MNDIYKNIEEYNPNKRKILTAFDHLIVDMLSNKKRNPIATELFIYLRQKVKHFSCFYNTILFCCAKKYQAKFYALFYYESSKETRTSTFEFKEFINLYKKSTSKPYSFLVIDATLASDNLLRFRKNVVERI